MGRDARSLASQWRPVWMLGAVAVTAALACAPPGDESPAQRRQRLEAMSPAQKEEIRRHWEQFQALSADEQQRIRHLHQQIQDDPEAEKLRETMARYCQWLPTIPFYRRAQLQELEPSKRLKQIKILWQEQTKTAAKRLGPQDRDAVVRWMEQYATEHEAALLGKLPEARRHQPAKLTPIMRHRMAMGLLCQALLSNNAAVQPPITEKELAGLRAGLSSEARGRLEAKHVELARLLNAWLRQVARQELNARRNEGTASLPGFDERLVEFFEFQLRDEERDRLMSLPAEEMQQRLQDMYLLQNRPPAGGDHRADRPGQARKPAPTPPKGKKDNRAFPTPRI